MKSWDDKVIRVQDKGSRFVVLDTNSYIEKVEHQINRSSFDKLDADPSPKFKEKVNNWLEKWSDIIINEWKEFIRPDNSNAGKIYGMVKTHKADNPVFGQLLRNFQYQLKKHYIHQLMDLIQK